MDVERFLALPLVARVAANGPSGPTVRPVWFLYENGAFWWLTGSYSRMGAWLEQDSRVALVVDRCDLATGRIEAVTATGCASIHPLDIGVATRKLSKYLGADADHWPERFHAVLHDSAGALVTLRPAKAPRLRDLSYEPATSPADPVIGSG